MGGGGWGCHPLHATIVHSQLHHIGFEDCEFDPLLSLPRHIGRYTLCFGGQPLTHVVHAAIVHSHMHHICSRIEFDTPPPPTPRLFSFFFFYYPATSAATRCVLFLTSFYQKRFLFCVCSFFKYDQQTKKGQKGIISHLFTPLLYRYMVD